MNEIKEYRKPVFVLSTVIGCVVNALYAFAAGENDAITSAITSTATATATQATSMITSLLPIVMGVVGTYLVINLGIKVFKKTMNKAG